MEKVKLTKTALKKQKDNLKRYERYLPTLYIKKHQLQKEVESVRMKISKNKEAYRSLTAQVDPWISLLGEDVGLKELVTLQQIETKLDTIAGVDIPVFVTAHIHMKRYDLFEYPLWVDRAVATIRDMIIIRSERMVLKHQERCLLKELRVTAQRVNLFEQVKIPETKDSIRRIAIYLSDQQIAAVGWAGIAKKKIQEGSLYD